MAETQSFGKWLHHRRRELDLAQSELGSLVGCAQVTIKKIEADDLRPSRQLAELLIEKLGVPPRDRELYVRFARDGSFPAESQASETQNNLPVELTSFIGREREIEEVIRLLSTARLITLTGAGGVGKSRLALQVAARVLDRYPDGAWFFNLASITDPEIVPLSVATALGLPIIKESSYQSMLVQYLQKKDLLLILDNCEHLIDKCAHLVYALLLQCPKIKILTTCRETLDVDGEIVYHLPSLTNLDPLRTMNHHDLKATDSVRLFIERAAAILPDFSLDNQDLTAIARICYRLDGIPLAIELAAARISALSAEQIADRLDDRFRLLIIGNRTALPRHRTLRASIDWSYNLLSEPERLLLQRLSVFAGGWTLEAAESACAFDQLQQEDIVDALTGLVKKSLIQIINSIGGLNRSRMLETIRQYAQEKLSESGQVSIARDHHLGYYLRLVEKLEPRLRGRELVHTLDRLENELDNLRLALEWGLQTNVEAELKMAAALQRFWHIRSLWLEAIDWLERGLAAQKISACELGERKDRKLIRAKALTALGFHRLTPDNSTWREAQPALNEALAIYQECDLGKNRDLAWSLLWLGLCKFYEGNLPQSKVFAQDALSIFRNARDARGMSEAFSVLASNENDLQIRLRIYNEKLAIERAESDVAGIAHSLLQIGMANSQDGHYENARIAYEESQAYYQEVKFPIRIATLYYMLGSVAHALGDLHLAGQYSNQSIQFFREFTNDWGVFAHFWHWMWIIAEGRFTVAEEPDNATSNIKESIPSLETNPYMSFIYARIARLQGTPKLAQAHVQDILTHDQKFPAQKVVAFLELGHLAMENGDLKQAGALWREGIRILESRRDLFWLFFMFDPMAMLALRENQPERAARLFGTRWCRGFFHMLSPGERDQHIADFAFLRSALGETRFEELYEEGRLLSLEQAVELAIEEAND